MEKIKVIGGLSEADWSLTLDSLESELVKANGLVANATVESKIQIPILESGIAACKGKIKEFDFEV